MILLLLYSCFTMTFSLNILMIVPTLSYSHISFNSKIADILSSKGHEVLVLIPDIDSSVPSPSGNYTVLRKDVGIVPGELTSMLWRNPNPYEDSSPLNYKIFLKLMRVSSMFVRACEALANDNILMDSLRKHKFDVGMLEQYDSCGFGIFRTIGLNSFVWLSATGAYAEQPRTIGIDYPSSYVPNLFAPLADKMSFAERVENWLISTVTRLVFSHSRARESRIFWNTGNLAFGEDLYNTATSSDAVIVNSLPAVDFSMPTSNKVAYTGGITIQRQPQRLDTYWKEIADSSTRGFVLVTFGSIAKTVDMTPEMQSNFFTAFSRFPEITFIVKYESANCTLPIPPNVELTRWIPQAGLMNHKNYRGIITHGGWSSILESLTVGKPMILMPLFADHGKNSKVMQAKGAAVILDKMHLTVYDIMRAIAKVIKSRRYRKACEKLSRILEHGSPNKEHELIHHLVVRASKPSRRKFPLTPKNPLDVLIGMHIEIFAIIMSLLLVINS